MSNVVISLSSRQKQDMWNHLLGSKRGTEEAGFLFATERTEDPNAFKALEWYAVPPQGFSFCSAYHFELSDETRALVIKRAHDLGASLVEVHSHVSPLPPAFSASDLLGFQEFVPHVWWRLKSRPYFAVVVSEAGIDGLVWRRSPQEPERLRGIEVNGMLAPASHRSRFPSSTSPRGVYYG